MTNFCIESIEWGTLEGQRPRSAGCNARLPIHGPIMRDPIARVTLDDGSSGFGWSRVTQAQAQALIGKPLSDLISIENGVTDLGYPIEFALWDLLGQRAGKPVYVLAAEHYGSQLPDPYRAPCYDTTLYFDDLHLTSHDEAASLLADEARQGWARGHRAFKLKVGRGALHMPLDIGIARDIAVIRAVRRAVGPEIPLMIDANNGWNANIAKQVLAAVADCNILWLEEAFHEDPILYEHLQGWMGEQGMRTWIADGEGLAAPKLLEWAEAHLIDVVQYDLRDIGFTAWLKLGKQLDAWGAKSAPHNYGSNVGNYASCHLAGIIDGFTFVEWDQATTPGLDTTGYTLTDGWVSVPNLPGFGLTLNDAVFQQAIKTEGYRVSA
jgi:L-alanine-DL-glutamate epimerase-like enolase superfamily enzyme